MLHEDNVRGLSVSSFIMSFVMLATQSYTGFQKCAEQPYEC